MKSFSILLIIPFSIMYSLSAQSEWEYHVAINDSYDVEIFENTAYVANRAGLLIINLDTGEETLLHPGNSNMTELGVREIVVLSNGDLWLTNLNREKLFYFDGSTFTQHADDLSYIFSLSVVNDELWFFSIGVGSTVVYSLSDGVLQTNEIDAQILRTDQDSNLWVTTSSHIAQYDGSNFIDTIELPFQEIYDHFVDSDNRHWIASYSPEKIAKYENGAWTEFNQDIIVSGFYEIDPGEIFVPIRNNKVLQIIDDQFVEMDKSEILTSALGNCEILHIESSEDVWLQSESALSTERLFRMTQDTILQYGINDSFEASPIKGLSQDCDGNLLCIDDQFVQRNSEQNWETIIREQRGNNCLLNNFVIDDFSCETWLSGSSSSCFSVWQLESDSLVETDILLQSTDHLHRDDSGNFYYTGNNPGRIIKLNNLGVSSTLLVPDATSLRGLLVSKDQKIYTMERNAAGELQPIFIENDIKKIVDLNIPSIPDINLGFLIFEDSKGDIWYQEQNGLIKYDGVTAEFFPFGFEHSESDRLDITEDAAGNFWIATVSNGIIKWSPANTQTFTTFNSALLSNQCFDLEIIDDQLWVNHFSGLSKMKIDGLETSTEELSKSDSNPLQYLLYPNPSHGLITITNPQLNKRQIDIYSMSGALVSSHETSSPAYDVHLEAGVYWVRLEEHAGKAHVAIEKVVVF